MVVVVMMMTIMMVGANFVLGDATDHRPNIIIIIFIAIIIVITIIVAITTIIISVIILIVTIIASIGIWTMPAISAYIPVNFGKSLRRQHL